MQGLTPRENAIDERAAKVSRPDLYSTSTSERYLRSPTEQVKTLTLTDLRHSGDELGRDGTRDSGGRSDATHTLSAEARKSWDLSPRGASRDTYQTARLLPSSVATGRPDANINEL